jgi:hypothetical protein
VYRVEAAVPTRGHGPRVSPTVLLQCCYSVVTVLLQCCYSVVTVVLQWCYSGVRTVLQRCKEGVIVVLAGSKRRVLPVFFSFVHFFQVDILLGLSKVIGDGKGFQYIACA